MKTFKIFLTFGLLVTATVSANANDYASSETYPLLNDMKMAQKEQLLLKNMRSLISDHKHNNKEKLLAQKKIFSTIITGLTKGDKQLNLHGTEILSLKNKITSIQLLWSQEKTVLDSAIHNAMYTDDAYDALDKLTMNLKELNTLYRHSYKRYKKNSKMKSLVSSYMQKTDKLLSKSVYAMK